MNKYLICYTGVSNNSFISKGLDINDISNLRIRQSTYLDDLQNSLRDQGIKIIVENKEFPDIQTLLYDLRVIFINKNIIYYSNDRMGAINMQFYPLSFKEYALFIKKGLIPDFSSILYLDNDRRKISSVFFTSQDMENNEFLRPPVYCYTGNNKFVNLSSAIEVVRLFNLQPVARHFNNFVDSTPGYFRKSSTQKVKIHNEYNFLSNLPAPVRPFYPHCGNYYESNETSAYDIEIIKMLDVSKLLINNYFDSVVTCKELLDKISIYFSTLPRLNVSLNIYNNKMRSVFIDKTRERFENLPKLNIYSELDKISQLQINMSLDEFSTNYISELESTISQNSDTELWYSHGDLFFGNMLYDPVMKEIKLIDPRGGVGEDCYLPKWYDLAKLSHSFLGQYDLMVYELIKPIIDKNIKLNLIPDSNVKGLENLRNSFLEFIRSNNIDLRRLRLYEGSLFLSMIPLHQESPLRMAMQLIRSIEIYKEISTSK